MEDQQRVKALNFIIGDPLHRLSEDNLPIYYSVVLCSLCSDTTYMYNLHRLSLRVQLFFDSWLIFKIPPKLEGANWVVLGMNISKLWDPPPPLSFRGRSRLLGEHLLRKRMAVPISVCVGLVYSNATWTQRVFVQTLYPCVHTQAMSSHQPEILFVSSGASPATKNIPSVQHL